MDKDGIPITMCIHPGNTNEQITAIPLEKELMRMTESSKFIYCADAGLGSNNIRVFNSMGGRAFIVTQSIKKLSAELKQAVFNDFDYRLLSDNRKMSVKEMKEFDRKRNTNKNLESLNMHKLNLDLNSILDKRFPINFKGYDPTEVDVFLDLILEDYQTFQKIIAEQDKNALLLNAIMPLFKQSLLRWKARQTSRENEEIKIINLNRTNLDVIKNFFRLEELGQGLAHVKDSEDENRKNKD